MFRKIIFINILLILITLVLNNTVNTILIVGLFVNLIAYSLRNPQNILKVKASHVIVFPIYLLIILLIGLLYTKDLNQGFNVLTLNIPLALPFLIYRANILDSKDFEKIIVFFSVFLVFFVSFFIFKQIEIDNITTTVYKLNSLFATEIIHPSYLTIYMIFSLLILYELDFKNHNKYLIFGLMLLLLTFIVLLSSKLVLIIAIYFSLKLFFKFNKLQFYNKLSIISILSLTLLIFIIFPSKVKQDINNYYNLLFKKQKAVDIYTYKKMEVGTPTAYWNKVNRIIIWRNSIDVIKENLPFGVGTGDYIDALNKMYKKNNESHHLYERNLNSHNQFLDFLIKYGIVGFLIFSIMLAKLLFEGVTQNNKNKIIFIAVFFFFAIGENYMSRQWGVVFFSIILPLVYINNKQS